MKCNSSSSSVDTRSHIANVRKLSSRIEIECSCYLSDQADRHHPLYSSTFSHANEVAIIVIDHLIPVVDVQSVTLTMDWKQAVDGR